MKLKTILGTFIIGISIFVTTNAEAPVTDLPDPSATEMVAFYFGKDAERMMEIFTCESGMKQFDSKGNVIMSHTRDFGIAQINEKVWDKKAKELGLDYKGSMIDNLQMAKYILDRTSPQAWVCNRIV